MPTTQEFYASGRGNGFPFCITKVDMTQPTSSPTWAAPVINPMTLSQAMSLYWNLYGMIGTATATGTSGTSTQSDLNIPDTDTPISRVCGDTYSDYREETTGAPDYPTTIQSVGVHPEVIAMYDGVTTDEGNLLGYAMGDSELPRIVAWCQASVSSVAEVNLFAGYVPAISDSDAWTHLSSIYVPGFSEPTLTNVTFQGIPFITADLNIGTTGVSATITDVELYTYI